jgi:hypothetical protein
MGMQDWHKYAFITVILLNLCAVSTAQGEDALNPRINGDWSQENAPIPTDRQNCHPAMSICQLPVRPITKNESDLNQGANSGERMRSPTPLSLTPQEGNSVGPEIGEATSFNDNSVRSGPAIKH